MTVCALFYFCLYGARLVYVFAAVAYKHACLLFVVVSADFAQLVAQLLALFFCIYHVAQVDESANQTVYGCAVCVDGVCCRVVAQFVDYLGHTN